MPFSLTAFIEKNQDQLKPPINNKMMFGKGCQFKVMVVGGPNTRTDFHIEAGEEWFYMVKGDMVLRINDGGIFKNIPIKEGESFLLPAGIPHSPQRKADTIGIVIERERKENEYDHMRWYCREAGCGAIIRDMKFHCVDLGSQVKAAVEEYYGDEAKRTCPKCGVLDTPARPGQFFEEGKGETKDDRSAQTDVPRVNPASHPPPLPLMGWIKENQHLLKPPVGNKMIYGDGCQFKVMVVGGPNTRSDYHIDEGEEWFWQLKGDMCLKVVDGGEFKDIIIREGECFLLPANIPHSPQRKADTIGLVIERERDSSELDGLRWYCKQCQHVTHQDYFHCQDLVGALKNKIESYYAQEATRTCSKCGTIDQRP